MQTEYMYIALMPVKWAILSEHFYSKTYLAKSHTQEVHHG